jgi:hypothetical protein
VLESNKPGRVWPSTALGHRGCSFSLVSDYLHRARCGPRALAQSPSFTVDVLWVDMYTKMTSRFAGLQPEEVLGLSFDETFAGRGAFQCRVPVLRFLQSIHVGKPSCGPLRSTLIVKVDGEEEVEMPEDLTLRMPIKCLNPAQRLRSWGPLGGVAVKSWQSSRKAYLTSSLRLASESELDKVYCIRS